MGWKYIGIAVGVWVWLGWAATLALAAEVTCWKADDRGCSMAKHADGTPLVVSVAGAKAGDRLECVEKDGKMQCKRK
ncbi:MAG: hypothetical protein FJZ47_23445 [Candidatus Tectomicrobia bacterium]|uniref:Uncharacterized protein n=1 Tax=Tectimicrobiota bacterium TaxID=2528274 RepID=A0A937W6P2_UNCTE|nr:hypothetical protein [Candidatus Tectomicrobia bacterium]